MDQLNFPSVWLQQRLEHALASTPADEGLLVSVPPCAFRGDESVTIQGKKVTYIANASAWASLCEQPSIALEPLCIVAPYPWWASTVAGGPGLSDYSWDSDSKRVYFSRCTDAELDMLLKSTATTSNPDPLDVSALRWASGGWPGLACAWLEGQASADGRHENASESIGFAAMQTCFRDTWGKVFENQQPLWRTLAKLPWLNRALLGEAFKVLPDQINTLVNQGWLLASPETPDGLELDPSLQRLLLATLHLAPRTLDMARAWYAREGHKAEAIHCAVALGTPIDELAARALMGPGSAPNEKASVGSKARPSSGITISGDDAMADALRRAHEALNIQRQPISPELISALISALSGQTASPGNPTIPSSFSGAARAPHSKASGGLLAGIARGKQAKSASLALQLDPLNHRETQILRKICTGLRNRDISLQLGLEISTVKWYATRIYAKLGVKNRTQAVVRAQELGLAD